MMMTGRRGSLTFPAQPSVSVLIPTKNRPADLEIAVKSVFRQTVVPPQVIVVDQSENNESRQLVERHYAELPATIREKAKLCYVWDPNIPGVNTARNRAMEIAEEDVWVFLDDDVYLEPDFLEELLAVYLRYPQVGGVSGIITNYQPPSWAFRFWMRLFARGPFRDERQPIYWKADRLRHAEPITVRKFGSGLMSFRAEVIRGIRFDDKLSGVPEGEDTVFCARLQPGTVLLVAPRARLVHKKSQIARPQEYWLKRYVYASQYFYHRIGSPGARNWLYLAWLIVGCALVAAPASLRRRSLEPWRALVTGMQEGRKAGLAAQCSAGAVA